MGYFAGSSTFPTQGSSPVHLDNGDFPKPPASFNQPLGFRV